MKRSKSLRLAIALRLLAAVSPAAFAADSSELADLRTRLLEAFQSGRTDQDNEVKQLRSKIAALEYIAAAKPGAASEAVSRPISVDFPGGSAAALVSAVRAASGDVGFNVIGEKADLAIELPAFSIRNADPVALGLALNGILQPRGYVLMPNGRTTAGQAPVFTLRKMSPYEADYRTLGQLQSFQLAPYLEHQTVDDIIGAIRTAWELDPARNPSALRLKFHPPTGILLVSAPADGIQVVATVLKELRRSDQPKPPRPANSTPTPER